MLASMSTRSQGAGSFRCSWEGQQGVMNMVHSMPPTASTNLKATIKGRKVQLAWGAASDNVGVSSYAIWRNRRMHPVRGSLDGVHSSVARDGC
jgi:hypothetical protein